MVYDHLPHDKYEKYRKCDIWGVYTHSEIIPSISLSARGLKEPPEVAVAQKLQTQSQPGAREMYIGKSAQDSLASSTHPRYKGKDLVENRSKIPKVAQFLLFLNLCGYHFPQTTRLGAPTIPTLGAPSRFLWRTGRGPAEQHMITDLPRREDRKPIVCWVPKKSPACRRLSSSIRFYMFSVVLL